MRYLLIVIIAILIPFNYTFSSPDDAGHQYHSRYKDKKYVSLMPISTLKTSPDFDLNNPTLPKPLSSIIEVAQSQLVKITGTKEGWNSYSIAFNNWRENNKKWFYAVGFDQEDFMSMAHITILVTIDGQLGVIKEVTEKIID